MAKLTHQQKLDALAFRFYQDGKWTPKAGDFYTTSRADLELYQVVSVENGVVRTRYTEGSDTISEWAEGEFLTEGFGPRRVFVPEWVLSALRSPPEPVSVVEDEERWRLFPKKTPEEVDRDPVHQEVSRQLKPLRDAFFPPEPGRDAPEPVAWVIPGDDNARADGYLDAMAWREGEFTRPLFASPPDVELVRMREQEQADFERGQALLVNIITRPLIGIENRTAQEVFDVMCDRARAALSAKEAGK
jgi:hypothetical protein